MSAEEAPAPRPPVSTGTGRASRVPPVVALAAGVLLWLVPTVGEPVVRPIGDAMRDVGLLAADTGTYAADFSAILMLRWLAAALLLVFVLSVERRPVSSIGVRVPRVRDVLLTTVLAVVVLVLSVVLFSLVVGAPDEGTQTSQIVTALSLAQLVHLIINAAVVEEIFFRGFLMERLIDITRRPWLAALVSYVIFVGSHVPGSGWLLTLTMTAVGSVLFVGLYWLRRNVLLCILAHAITDIVVLAGALD